MRSDLVFAASKSVTNSFHLCQLIARAARKLHRPHTAIPQTINEAFTRCAAPVQSVSAPVVNVKKPGTPRARKNAATRLPRAA